MGATPPSEPENAKTSAVAQANPSASLHKVGVAILPDWAKPDIDREATSTGNGRTPRGDTGQRASKDQQGT
jgi:hypothetical protein